MRTIQYPRRSHKVPRRLVPSHGCLVDSQYWSFLVKRLLPTAESVKVMHSDLILRTKQRFPLDLQLVVSADRNFFSKRAGDTSLILRSVRPGSLHATAAWRSISDACLAPNALWVRGDHRCKTFLPGSFLQCLTLKIHEIAECGPLQVVCFSGIRNASSAFEDGRHRDRETLSNRKSELQKR